MKLYISNILPRLKNHTRSLSEKEVFVDKPWVMIDENNNTQKYIFQRNGDLIMSYNGQAEIGKWQYIKSANSILIDRNKDKLLLNQGFLNKVVMVLKKDGYSDKSAKSLMVLANEKLLPNLDIDSYLIKLHRRLNFIKIEMTNKGQELEIVNCYNYYDYLGKKVFIDYEDVPDQSIFIKENTVELVIVDSKISRAFMRKEYETPQGKIYIDESSDGYYSKIKRGNEVYDENLNSAPDGKYRINWLKRIKVRNGRVV